MKLKETKNMTVIETTKKSAIYLVDPAKNNFIRMNSMNSGFQKFGPTENGLYGKYVYEVEIILHDLSIHDGDTCFNYQHLKSSYGNCLEEVLKEFFLHGYKCLPPWFPNSNSTCELNKNLQLPNRTMRRII